MRPFVVLKFGGTSVATKTRWDTIAEIAKSRYEEGFRPVIVCSAISGISNALEDIIKRIQCGEEFDGVLQDVKSRHFRLSQELAVDAACLSSDLRVLEQLLLDASLAGKVTPQVHAHAMSFGEILATRLGEAYLNARDLRVIWQDARECLLAKEEFQTNAQRQFLAGSCHFDADKMLQSRFHHLPSEVILTQGFIARNEIGDTVLLGRGGSDTSASYFAAKLEAKRCEIWTDVPGLYTANPRQVQAARMLRQLDYEEAQEMATMGAKVLHPRCISPVKQAGIELHIRSTNQPEVLGTVISERSATEIARVKCISTKLNVTLISIENLGMWQEVGFLADLFGIFKKHGISVDLVSTSETNVTVTIDPMTNALQPLTLDALNHDLTEIGRVRCLNACAVVSLVGRNIRSILHQLGPALRVFEEQKVFLVSQAASDLNLSFVVLEDEAPRLVQDLHQLLFTGGDADPAFGPSWQENAESKGLTQLKKPFWWEKKSEELLRLAHFESPLYVYDGETLENAANSLSDLRSIHRLFYAVKANDNADVLKTFYRMGLGFECVSKGELDRVYSLFDAIDSKRVLFTPNFAAREEFIYAFKRGCHVTVDNLFTLEKWPEVFRGREIFLRLDPGQGRGHHQHVQTAGEHSKFGISQPQIEKAIQLVESCEAIVTGLHAHAGSGITEPSHWVQMAEFLTSFASRFPDARIINLGGGLSVPSQIGDVPMDLSTFDDALIKIHALERKFEIWLEPGRFLVANAGVLLTRVTQLKEKGDIQFVGVNAGMNSLIRPVLYGAYHFIANLSRLNEPNQMTAHVVGPICESGDTLGYDRRLPKTAEGDVLLIANVGAYGRVMSSSYNRRQPAAEYFIAI